MRLRGFESDVVQQLSCILKWRRNVVGDVEDAALGLHCGVGGGGRVERRLWDMEASLWNASGLFVPVLRTRGNLHLSCISSPYHNHIVILTTFISMSYTTKGKHNLNQGVAGVVSLGSLGNELFRVISVLQWKHSRDNVTQFFVLAALYKTYFDAETRSNTGKRAGVGKYAAL